MTYAQRRALLHLCRIAQQRIAEAELALLRAETLSAAKQMRAEIRDATVALRETEGLVSYA